MAANCIGWQGKEVLMSEATKKILNDFTAKVDKDPFEIDVTTVYPELNYAISINGIGCMPLGDIQGIKAKAKQGKTLTESVFMAAILIGRCLGITSNVTNAKVLFFDTEQHQRSTAKVVERVHKLCGWDVHKNYDNFSAFSLRSMDIKERLPYILKKIAAKKPHVVFIDGCRDLLHDFNNIEESSNVINTLMKASEECNTAIVNVLHTNKGKEDSNMRGHLWTELLNKCSDVWEVKKDGLIFKVEETDCRNIPTDNWCFTLDESGIPIQLDIEPELSKEEIQMNKMKENFCFILAGQKSLSYTSLSTEYSELTGLKTPTSNRHIGMAVKAGIIQKGNDNNYRLL